MPLRSQERSTFSTSSVSAVQRRFDVTTISLNQATAAELGSAIDDRHLLPTNQLRGFQIRVPASNLRTGRTIVFATDPHGRHHLWVVPLRRKLGLPDAPRVSAISRFGVTEEHHDRWWSAFYGTPRFAEPTIFAFAPRADGWLRAWLGPASPPSCSFFRRRFSRPSRLTSKIGWHRRRWTSSRSAPSHPGDDSKAAGRV